MAEEKVMEGVNTSPSTALEWFDTMTRSAKDKNYHGRFIYMNHNEVRSIDIIHAKKEVEYEKIEHLSGKPYQIIRHGEELYCLEESGKWMKMNRAELLNEVAFIQPIEQVEKLSSYYQIQKIGSSRVAGRNAIAIEFEPTDSYRYVHRFWIDKESGLMLKYNIYEPEKPLKKPLEMIEYVLLETNVPFDPMEFNIPPSFEAMMEEKLKTEEKTAPNTNEDWQIEWVPPGFIQIDTQTSWSVKNKGTGIVLNKTYSDGLSMFTLFIQHRPDLKKNKITKMGVTTVVEWSYDAQSQTWITVMGDLPSDAAIKIVSSVVKKTL